MDPQSSAQYAPPTAHGGPTQAVTPSPRRRASSTKTAIIAAAIAVVVLGAAGTGAFLLWKKDAGTAKAIALISAISCPRRSFE